MPNNYTVLIFYSLINNLANLNNFPLTSYYQEKEITLYVPLMKDPIIKIQAKNKTSKIKREFK